MTSHKNKSAFTLTNTNLDEVNVEFHGAYEDGRKGAETQGVVLVFLGDALHVVDAGSRAEVAVTPKAFHMLKSIAHAPIAIYVMLSSHNGGALPKTVVKDLQRVHKTLAAALAADAVAQANSHDSALARQVLTECLAFVEDVQERKALDAASLKAFARAIGPALLRLTETATALQLEFLHHAVQTALAGLSREKRKRLHVVVVGDHQARERSFAMQYFLLRLQEPEGEESRVTYAENAESVDEALALVGTQRLDRKVATAFFGDSKRLQRDVLGDAASALLKSHRFEPIATD